jgi:transposase
MIWEQMAPPASHLQNLLPGRSCLKLQRIEEQDGCISILATAAAETARCPTYHRLSSRIHSRYWRTVRDLPWQGAVVQLRIEVRRFRCRGRDCPRKTFVERLPMVMASHARQTIRLSETIRLIGYALGGEAGSRLADRLGLETSPDTMLRRIKQSQMPRIPARLAIVGVDDWAWRKGQRYGTILVDLERHVPIDLMADRSAEGLESWLKAHPGVTVISRDRAGAYAEGATKGAPEAVQVADRFHLLCNLTSAVERSLESRRAQLRSVAEAEIAGSTAGPAAPSGIAEQHGKPRSEQRKQERRQRRLERYDEVVRLYGQCLSQTDISRKLNLARKTVRRYLRAGQFPERAQPPRRATRVATFQSYLEQRWKEGCHNATQLWRELQTRGYTGGRSMVAHLVSSFRTQGTKYFRPRSVGTAPKRRDLSPRQAAMLMAKRSDDLTANDQELLARLVGTVPEIGTMYTLMKSFGALLREHRSEDLSTWSAAAAASGLPELKRFCTGLERDRAAVIAAIELPWSNGQVEGQVHRLKLIKRQMYGRAGFPLLRTRVLPFYPQPDGAIGRRAP